VIAFSSVPVKLALDIVRSFFTFPALGIATENLSV